MNEPGQARVWYQRFVDPAEQAPYIGRLHSRLQALASVGIIVEVHGISPPDRHFHPITEVRCAQQTIPCGDRGGARRV